MDGVFQVKDAYSIAQAAHEDASCSLGLDPLWSTVWRLYIPPKARIFLWRALSDIFPHGVNLRSKGIEGVGACLDVGKLRTICTSLLITLGLRRFGKVFLIFPVPGCAPLLRKGFLKL